MEQQEWFTASEAADFLRVTRSTINRWVRDGRLKAHVLPSGVGRRIHRAELEGLPVEAPDRRLR